jgi:heme-degrading monooxygenase HmoA
MTYQIAQLNIAKMKFPLDDPRMKDFADALDSVNAIADSSEGFVWRLQTDDGNATSVRAYDDESLLVNVSVWESVEDLKAFVAGREHLSIMRRRQEWFEPTGAPYVVLWWIPRGHTPTVEEAAARLDHLRENGASSYAFDFSNRYDADVETGADA